MSHYDKLNEIIDDVGGDLIEAIKILAKIDLPSCLELIAEILREEGDEELKIRLIILLEEISKMKMEEIN